MKRQIEKIKEVGIQSDCAQFTQMIIIAEDKTLKMNNVLSHPLGLLPWALASFDGSMRRTNCNKSSLTKEHHKNMTATEII